MSEKELEFQRILDAAKKAANEAGKKVKPTPMTVGMAVGFGNEIIPGTEEVVDEGVCGFAWIKIPGRGGFAKYVKENNYGRKDVYKGIYISSYALHDYNGQSMERKEAAMNAAAEVLRENGIKAYAYSRMD